MGFEDSDGVTRRFNYCRPGATYNFCHSPIAAFHQTPGDRPVPLLDFSALAARASPDPFFFLFFLPASLPPPRPRPRPRPRLPFLRAGRRFFSALLPEPQNGAKMRYRFAEPGLAADRSADLVRARIPPLHLRPSRSRAFVLSTSVATTAAAAAAAAAAARRERALLSAPPPPALSILCSRDERGEL